MKFRIPALALAGALLITSASGAQMLPAGVVERAITVPGPVPLPGTLTLPAGKGPFHAVVLVHGSGPGDRDETVGDNKPFRDVAWGLAAQGVAVLRYDKRAFVSGKWYLDRSFTVFDETTQDALSALTLMRSTPEIDASHLFLLGHSLGGMLAPRIAAADGRLAGIVIMSGATRVHVMDQMDRQLAYIATIAGPQAPAVEAQRTALKPIIDKIRSLTPADTLDKTALPGLGGTGAPYWYDLNQYDGAVTMKGLHIPALILQGMRDYQVPPDQLDDWLKIVGQRTDITVKRYPDANHLMMAGSGPPSPADYSTAGHVEAAVISDIIMWVKGH